MLCPSLQHWRCFRLWFCFTQYIKQCSLILDPEWILYVLWVDYSVSNILLFLPVESALTCLADSCLFQQELNLSVSPLHTKKRPFWFAPSLRIRRFWRRELSYSATSDLYDYAKVWVALHGDDQFSAPVTKLRLSSSFYFKCETRFNDEERQFKLQDQNFILEKFPSSPYITIRIRNLTKNCTLRSHTSFKKEGSFHSGTLLLRLSIWQTLKNLIFTCGVNGIK